MKPPRSRSHDQLLLAVDLGGLLPLGLFLWLDDATHQLGGESRFVGTAAPSARP